MQIYKELKIITLKRLIPDGLIVTDDGTSLTSVQTHRLIERGIKSRFLKICIPCLIFKNNRTSIKIKMTKTEFLSASLPYGLKCLRKADDGGEDFYLDYSSI